MKLRLVAVGRVREPYVNAALEDFRQRLRRLESFDELEVRASAGTDPARAMRDEGRRIVQGLEPGEPLWLLDRTGEQISSIDLSRRLTALADRGTHRLTFAIGGAYGASDELRARATFVWSLSALTLLHEWARALVVEQLYRAAKIARNEPYHH